MSESNLDWSDDCFGRLEGYARFLTNFLLEQTGEYVLNIDAKWGHGKTFFIDRWALELKKSHLCVSINAWETDYSNNPLTVVISEIEKQIREQLPKNKNTTSKLNNFLETGAKIARSMAPAVAAQFVKKIAGEGGISELSGISEEDEGILAALASAAAKGSIDSYRKTTDQVKEFNKKMREMIMHFSQEKNWQNKKKEKISLPIFVFIDELDRCRPSYAIEMLEQVKHLFSVEGLIFIVATDTEQLSKSISSVYGHDFDGYTYLRRFFNREFVLPEPEYDEYSKLLRHKYLSQSKLCNRVPEGLVFGRFSEDGIVSVFSMTARYFGLSLREQDRCFAQLAFIITNFSAGHYLHLVWSILLIVLRAKEPQIYEQVAKAGQPKRETYKEIVNLGGKNTEFLWWVDTNWLQFVQFYFDFMNANTDRFSTVASNGTELEKNISSLIKADLENLKMYPRLVGLSFSIK